jgi:hypothetical protein
MSDSGGSGGGGGGGSSSGGSSSSSGSSKSESSKSESSKSESSKSGGSGPSGAPGGGSGPSAGASAVTGKAADAAASKIGGKSASNDGKVDRKSAGNPANADSQSKSELKASGAGQWCDHCHRDDHDTDSCPNWCSKCHKAGHSARECPHSPHRSDGDVLAGKAGKKAAGAADKAGDKAAGTAGKAGDKAAGAAGKAGDKAAGTAGKAGDKAAGAAGKAGDKAAGAAGKAGDKAAGAAGKAGDKAAGAAGKAGDKAAGGVSAYKDDALQAKEALENKDATGVADAAVRAGAKAGAEALAPGVGGTAANAVLDTAIGRKISRGVSKGVIVAAVVPVLIFGLVIGAIGMTIVALTGGVAGVTAATVDILERCTVNGESLSSGGTVSEPDENSKARAQAVWDVLKNAGLSDEAAAGVLGNLHQETGGSFDPTLKQQGGPGMGIAQWSIGGRWDTGPESFLEFAQERGLEEDSVVAQAEFIVYEMKQGWGGFKLKKFSKETNIADATVYFHDMYERSEDSDNFVRKTRGGYAKDWYKRLSGTSGSTSPTKPVSQQSNKSRQDVFVVGDSLTVGTEPYLPQRFTVNAKVGRTTSKSVDIVKDVRAQNADAWIVALGTNDYTDPEGFRVAAKAIVKAADDRPVTWVNIHVRNAPQKNKKINTIIASLDDNNANVTVADFDAWTQSVKKPDRMFAKDGIHLTDEGYNERAKLYTVDESNSPSGGVSGDLDCDDGGPGDGFCEAYPKDFQERFKSSSQYYSFSMMSPDAQFVMECVRSRFNMPKWQPITRPDHHPAGDKAIDFMTPIWPGNVGCVTSSDTGDKKMIYEQGNQLAADLVRYRKELGVMYVIWQDRRWSPGKGLSPNLPPEQWPIDTFNNADCNNEHYNHLHVGVYGNKHTGFAVDGWVAPVGKNTWGGPPACRKHPILGYYRDHDGWDSQGVTFGEPIRAASSGKVVSAAYQGGYGNVVFLKHPNGMTSRYAHMQIMSVRAGSLVQAGERIGSVGSTGLSTGAHLHFELHSPQGVVLDAREMIENGKAVPAPRC